MDAEIVSTQKEEDSTIESKSSDVSTSKEANAEIAENTTSKQNGSGSDSTFKMPTMLPPPPKVGRKSDNAQMPPDASTTTSGGVENTSDQPLDQVTPSHTSPTATTGQAGESEADKVGAKSPAELAKAKSVPLPYQEPSWGGLPDKEYCLEVLKNGTIVETIKLVKKSFFVVGRLVSSDIVLEHPSLSRYHAVLQYKAKGSPEKPVGFYLFDLDSTHGSFHNKNKCFPKTFYRLRVGHMIKFGLSTRSLILQGPDEDCEEESELSMTELKALAAEKSRIKMEEKLKEKENESTEDAAGGDESVSGASWGMAEDAEDFPDMDKNPFAETADNESLYINDPKKALQNWFDREGYDLEYVVEEKGYAQFLCKIELPVDAPGGHGSATAEALVKGKKKESTVQAALEACRILDRLGLLRPTHQSVIEKKVKKWEEDDFYASDDDEFLDRTGSIQKKRKHRMRMAGKEDETVETYESLVKKFEETKTELVDTESELKEAIRRKETAGQRSDNNDLDSYLAELRQGAQVDKETIQKLKMKVMRLSQEQERLTKLINIARPASMPELKPAQKADAKSRYAGVMIGKRGSKGLLGKVKNVSQEPRNPAVLAKSTDTKVLEAFLREAEDAEPKRSRLSENDAGEDLQPIGYESRPELPKAKDRIGDTSVNKPPRTLGPSIPQAMRNKIVAEPDNAPTLPAVSEPSDVAPSPLPSSEQEASESTAVPPTAAAVESVVPPTEDATAAESKEKKRRGDRGTKRRKKPDEEEEAVEVDDFYRVGMDKKYDVWVPPSDQTGDGRTSLNDKLGY